MPRETTDTTSNRPSWNSSPTELPKFLPTLEQFLLGVNTNFRRLWTQRCVMYRARTYVLNATHARLLATDTYPSTYSFSAPAPAVVAYVAILTPVVTLPTPVAPSTGGDDEGASTTPPAAPPATPTVPAVTVTDYSNTLTAAEEKKFVINDDQIDSVDEELLEETPDRGGAAAPRAWASRPETPRPRGAPRRAAHCGARRRARRRPPAAGPA